MLEAILLIVPISLMLFAQDWVFGRLIAITMLLLALPGLLVMRGGAPFVATPRKTMDGMLRLAGIKSGETVIDAGCGDGRMVFAAARLGAKAIGYELSVPTFLVAKIRSLFHPHASIYFKDLWKQDYRHADVVFCYLLTDTMHKFERTIWPTLRPGARVVSHAFTFKSVKPDGEDAGAVLYVKR